ncbi:MAG: serine/threonine protein kinase [Alphaproteobacteria bacterium]|nr:serine/threonine protein kinase [Alphaproteobacteria bacterium]
MSQEDSIAGLDQDVQERSSLTDRKKGQRAEIVLLSDSFGDPIEINTGERIPDYDSGPVKAYRAQGRDRTVGACFALVCEKHLVPRMRSISNYMGLDNPMLVPLISHGPAYWPPVRQQRYVFIYKDTLGKRIHKKGDAEALNWRQEAVMETVVKPMVLLLQEFRDRSFVHGAIRPSNMFASGSGGKIDQITLGDCLSLPASYDHPVLYETIERAMASPIGRGEGKPPDDLYSLGVTIAVLMRSHDPLHGMSDHDIIREKLENGSYAAITGRDRFKGSILELLRGLLHDSPVERWTLEEVMTWLDGRRLSPKQSLKHKKAARPIIFNNDKYLYSAILAMDLPTNPSETLRLVEGGDLEQWLQRSIEDEEMLENVNNSVKSAREKGVGPGYEDRMCSGLSAILDRNAPLRYKKLRLMGEGVGAALAEAMVLKQDMQTFADLFSYGIAQNWINSSTNTQMDVTTLLSKFDQCRNYLRQNKPGFGIERALYTLCPESPCLSEKLADYYIKTPEEMMDAFEDLCQKGKSPAMFLDRHTIAFLSVRDAKVVDPYLFELGSPEEYRKVLGNLKCLAALQKRTKFKPFSGIAKVFEEALPVVYARYHDREVRDRFRKAISKFVADGDLIKMAALLSNPEIIQQDAGAFRMAMQEYALLEKEYNTLEMRMTDKSSFGKSTGKEFAAIVSSVLAAIVMLFMVLMFMSNQSSF